MSRSNTPKESLTTLARFFTVLFNRAAMYKLDHPLTVSSISEFYEHLEKLLPSFSPVALIMERDQLYVEEEPVDPRINTSKIVAHFKKAGIQSVTFECGVTKEELEGFAKVFLDLQGYPTAEDMKEGLGRMGVLHVKINHVFFQKVTENEEVVSREKLQEMTERTSRDSLSFPDGEILGLMAKEIMMEEMGRSLSIQKLLEDPLMLSKFLIDADIATAQKTQTDTPGYGVLLAHQLRQIRKDIQSAPQDLEGVNLSELAEAVFDMRKSLMEGLETQKALGVVYTDEGRIHDEAYGIADQVLIQLVRKEYRGGQISVQRFAQVVRRLMPDSEELRRLLPKVKEALLQEGMPLCEFLEFIQELGQELQSEGLAQLLQKSAETIGLDGDELIREVRNNPAEAAELIFLAAEIRKGSGDEGILSDLLAEYVERIGCEVGLDTALNMGKQESGHLREVISNVQSDLLGKLRLKEIDSHLLDSIEQKLKRRLDESIKKMTSKWFLHQVSSPGTWETNKEGIFQLLEENLDGSELDVFLEEVRSGLRKHGIDDEKFQRLFREISKRKLEAGRRSKKAKLPRNTLNRPVTLYLIRKEISRALRYSSPFAVGLCSILSIHPTDSSAATTFGEEEIRNAVLAELTEVVRDADQVGYLDTKKIAIIYPVTDPLGAKIALRRMKKILHATCFTLKDRPFMVEVAGVALPFQWEKTPVLAVFVKTMEEKLNHLLRHLGKWYGSNSIFPLSTVNFQNILTQRGGQPQYMIAK